MLSLLVPSVSLLLSALKKKVLNKWYLTAVVISIMVVLPLWLRLPVKPVSISSIR